jgi:hypothetical protein
MQKMAEGARINTGELRYAGFWIRFAAKIVDGLILGIPLFAILMVVVMSTVRGGTSPMPDIFGLLAQLIFYAIMSANTGRHRAKWCARFISSPARARR